jgi:hypothetical protein
MSVMTETTPDENRFGRLADRTIAKLEYKPVAMILSVVGGMAASSLFTRLWRALSGQGSAPAATDSAARWADILPAAALHGVVFGVIKALLDRVGAQTFQRVTGLRPDPSPGGTAPPPPQP